MPKRIRYEIQYQGEKLAFTYNKSDAQRFLVEYATAHPEYNDGLAFVGSHNGKTVLNINGQELQEYISDLGLTAPDIEDLDWEC